MNIGNQINLQKSLEKLVVLQLLQDRLANDNTVIGHSIKLAISNSATPVIEMIQQQAIDNRSMMNEIIGEPLIDKILSF